MNEKKKTISTTMMCHRERKWQIPIYGHDTKLGMRDYVQKNALTYATFPTKKKQAESYILS